MLTILLVVAVLVPSRGIDAQSVNELGPDTTLQRILSELKTLKETCKGEEKCTTSDSQNSTDVTTAKCGCQPDCAIYGDCCRNSIFFKAEETSSTPYACVPTTPREQSYYMIAKCPKNTNPAERRLCENPKPTSDPVVNNLPITIATPKEGLKTFLNSHCAKCNAANLTLAQVWRPNVQCYDSAVHTPDKFKVKWNVTTEKWTLLHKGKALFYDCEIKFSPPEKLRDLRMCRKDGFVSKCLPSWQGTYDERMCHSYTAFVVADSISYRNVYCAKCNGHDETKVECVDLNFRSFDRPTSFTNLLKVDDDEIEKCGNTEIFDPIFMKCRNLVCGRNDCGEPVTVPKNVTKIQDCSRIALEIGTFELSKDRRVVRVAMYKRNFSDSEFLVNKNGQVEICSENVPKTPQPYSLAMGIITVIGLGVSIVFLVLHLCAVALVQELRNHSGMNLSSLCIALLGAYSSFIAGSLSEAQEQSCTIVAVLTYYFFMSAFFWMLIIAFDVWRVLRGAVRHFKSSSGRQYCRFFVYSLFAWGGPAMLTAAALEVETAAPGTVDDRFRPRFGEESCWFSRQLSLALFFATPLGIIMAFNAIFFVSSAYMASTSRLSSSPSSNVSGHHRDFRLYLRLAVLLGLTWVVGLLAAVTDYKSLWVCFVLFNTLQGLFIFAMFTCTSKVLKGLSKPHPWVNRLRDSLKIPSSKPTNTPPGSDVRFSQSQSTSDTTLRSSGNNTSVVEMGSQDRLSPSPSRKSSNHLEVAPVFPATSLNKTA